MQKKKVTKKVVVKKHAKPKREVAEYGWLEQNELSALINGGFFDAEGVLRNSEGCIRCTGSVKSTGKRCKNFAIPGETTCMVHGGISGRTKMGTRRIYSALVKDSRLFALLQDMDDSEGATGLRDELHLLRLLMAKIVSKSDDLDFSVKEVKDMASIISEIRNLVDVCSKMDLRNGKYMHVEKIECIVKQLEEVIRENISDQDILQRIANGFRSIIVPNAVGKIDDNITVESVRELPEKT